MSTETTEISKGKKIAGYSLIAVGTIAGALGTYFLGNSDVSSVITTGVSAVITALTGLGVIKLSQ